jgi:hypothetical protein
MAGWEQKTCQAVKARPGMAWGDSMPQAPLLRQSQTDAVRHLGDQGTSVTGTEAPLG